MERYFAKRTEGDYTETQRILAVPGHAQGAKEAYAHYVRMYNVKDGRSFFNALRGLLKELGKAGYTKSPVGWNVVGGKFVKFEDMTYQQLFSSFASVQQTIAKWVWNLVPANTELHIPLLEQGLVFRANDVDAVMGLLFELLHTHNGRFDFDAESGMYHLEGRLFKCLASPILGGVI